MDSSVQPWTDNQQQFEEYIKATYNVHVPLVIINYTETIEPGVPNPPNIKLDYDDLREMFQNFGEISYLEIKGKRGIILFKKFIDAFVSIEFLKNTENLKPEHLNSYTIRWYIPSEDDEFISEWMMDKISSLSTGEIVENINSTMLSNSLLAMHHENIVNDVEPILSNHFDYDRKNMNNTTYRPRENLFTDSTNFFNYTANLTLTPYGAKEFQNLWMANHQRGYNNCNFTPPNNTNYIGNSYEERYLTNGKFTCKFLVQIENDFEFKVARRLIGAKGCNMKKIIDFCSRRKNNEIINDAVKLRLRGKGSGYKEGPSNRESAEPLHWCVSSKYLDKYKWACSWIQELWINIYEEYKRFCERNCKTPSVNLTIHKIENVSAKRNTNSNNMYV